jgi:hypothetical protein
LNDHAGVDQIADALHVGGCGLDSLVGDFFLRLRDEHAVVSSQQLEANLLHD